MAGRDEDNGVIDPLDSFLDADLGQLPMASDGKFIPNTAVFETEPIPDSNEENFICLRGPCKYYLEMIPYFNAGNTKGSLDHRPIQFYRTCMRIAGYELELTDSCMMACNQWDPLSPFEKERLELRRNENYLNLPEKAEVVKVINENLAAYTKLRASRDGKEIG